MFRFSPLHAMVSALKRVRLLPFVYLAAIVLLPVVGCVNLGVKMHAVFEPRAVPALTEPLPPPPALDPTKQIAVVVASDAGAEVTDFLPTYDIFARSGLYNVYVVAPDRQPVPMIGGGPAGLNVVPHFSFASYQAAIGRAPDVIAVPYFPNYTPTRDAAVLDWLRAQAGPHTTFLAICSGTEILADTGLLDGHAATTNTGLFAEVTRRNPAVRWVHDVRYVDDGPVVTTTNLAAGMDATLHLVDRFGGRAVAAVVARQIGYPTLRYLDDPGWQPPSTALTSYLPAFADSAYRWGWERLGLVLTDGVDELRLAAVADPYTDALAAKISTVAATPAPVRSLHGLYLVPEYTCDTAPRFDRLIAPGGGDGEWAYGASLRDLARHHGAPVAAAVGQMLFLATEPGARPEAGFPVAAIAMPVLGLLGATAVFGIGRLRRRMRRSETAPMSPAGRVVRGVTRFTLHLVEMVLAMEVGMIALGLLNALIFEPAGQYVLTNRYPEMQVLAMGVFMAVPMVVWMRVRGHGWGHGLEMAGAMLAPIAAALALRAIGLVLPTALMAVAHPLSRIR